MGSLRTIGLFESTHVLSWFLASLPFLITTGLITATVGGATGIAFFTNTPWGIHAIAALLLMMSTGAMVLCCTSCLRSSVAVNITAFLLFSATAVITSMFSVLGLYSFIYAPVLPPIVLMCLVWLPGFHYGKIVQSMLVAIYLSSSQGGSAGNSVTGSGVSGAAPAYTAGWQQQQQQQSSPVMSSLPSSSSWSAGDGGAAAWDRYASQAQAQMPHSRGLGRTDTATTAAAGWNTVLQQQHGFNASSSFSYTADADSAADAPRVGRGSGGTKHSGSLGSGTPSDAPPFIVSLVGRWRRWWDRATLMRWPVYVLDTSGGGGSEYERATAGAADAAPPPEGDGESLLELVLWSAREHRREWMDAMKVRRASAAAAAAGDDYSGPLGGAAFTRDYSLGVFNWTTLRTRPPSVRIPGPDGFVIDWQDHAPDFSLWLMLATIPCYLALAWYIGQVRDETTEGSATAAASAVAQYQSVSR